MEHTDDHDPVIMYDRCGVCFYSLHAAWVYLAPAFRDMEPAEIVKLLRRHLLVVA